MFVPDARRVHIRDLNFILRSEIYVHWNRQLRASHLILRVEPVYSTWQSFKQALLVDSPLLSYIDVQHMNFLLPRFTVGEARESGRRYICSDELAPLRDESAECVSRCLRKLAHQPVQEEAPIQKEPAQPEEPVEPEAPVKEAEQVVVDITDPSDTEPFLNKNMVTRRAMTIDRFMLDARQATQQPPSQSHTQAPPPLPLPQTG